MSGNFVCTLDAYSKRQGREARREYQKRRRQKAPGEVVNYWLWKAKAAGDPVGEYVWARKMAQSMPKLNYY